MPQYSVEEEIDALATPGLLTERQAQAFVYRRIEVVPRYAAAEEMGLAESTLDDYVRDAERKIQQAEETLDALEEIKWQADGPIDSE